MENILVKHVLEREKLKDALNNSKMEFQSLADSVPGGISVWKAEDKISVRYYNDGWCELYGVYPGEVCREVRGRPVQGHLSSDRRG